MPAPFKKLSLTEFAELLREFRFTRRIDSVHMHHTWRPNHAQYKGHASIVAMWKFHTETNHWSDIGQHITIGPDGSIWTGRNWNVPPASATGNNGNKIAGPFMFEMVGDFDRGKDPFDGMQRDTALKVIALIQRKFGLPAESLKFHREMSDKTCPGSAIDYDTVLEAVKELHDNPEIIALVSAPRAPEVSTRLADLVDTRGREFPAGDPIDAEPADEAMSAEEIDTLLSGESLQAVRGATLRRELPASALADLRPHVINLRLGQFSLDGRYTTSAEDVDAIFEEELPKALNEARANNRPLRIMFYAHGGLVSESAGLQIARKHVNWWKQNNIYPIYFVWETGFMETIRQLLSRSQAAVREAVPRDIWDYTTDPVLETMVRFLQGPVIWGGMKHSAALASQPEGDAYPEGGAYYVATKLKDFCAAVAEQDNEAKLELHAMGHSAGSIFHAFFLPAALNLGVPNFASLQFLAPAIRVDTFIQLLSERIGAGKGIDYLTLFSMKKDFELDDNCAEIYRKSLLYLIHYALEAERKAPILGLEVSLRSNPTLKTLFGFDGHPHPSAEVVWSATSTNTGLSASTSRSHGGFDDDAPTMNSALRRILGLDDNDPIKPFPEETSESRDLRSWSGQVDLPDELRFRPSPPPPSGSDHKPVPPAEAAAHVTIPGAGARRALCVGINRYPTSPLFGCVADANTWSSTLIGLGFEKPMMLLDEAATRKAILDNLGALIRSSRSGDVIVFQYAGHGTTLPDYSGDEASGDIENKDEAICPFDFAEGNFLVDDDIAMVLNQVPSGVNMTCFIDCCHSGTITRFVSGLTPGAGTPTGSNDLPRFMAATPDMIAAHKRFRADQQSRGLRMAGGPNLMKEILFAAALSSEVAWESNGHGDFTVHATKVLREAASLTNQGFLERVSSAFGTVPRQHPGIYCQESAKSRLLLMPSTVV